MEIFAPLSQNDLLLLLIRISVLLLSARALGEVAQRFGQPAVVGELLAGIMLGPSLLSGAFPYLGQLLIPQTAAQSHFLEVMSMMGAMFLLLITGLETDLALVRRHARTALGVSIGGMFVCFASGLLLGHTLPDFLLVNPEDRTVFALFVATTLSITAIPVLAKVLFDLKLIRRDIGQTILAAAMSDDTIGWILLSIVAGIASGANIGWMSIVRSVGSVLVFMAFSFTFGRWLVRQTLEYVQDEVISQDRLLTLVAALTFTWAGITQALHLEPVLGAFVMGILFGQMPRLPDEVRHKLESIALGIFAPIFFAMAGLRVDILRLADPYLLGVAALVISVAIVAKIIGTYAGGRLIGRKDHWTALSFGAGLNARGAMQIIVATIGLSLGILTQEMFSIIIVMAMVTSLIAPASLRWMLKRVQIEETELKRLQHEELAKISLAANLRRVLLPVRRREHDPGMIQAIQARLLERMAARKDFSLTLLNVTSAESRPGSAQYLDAMGRMLALRNVVKKVVEHSSPVDTILAEAQKNYDLLVLGASDTVSRKDVVFTSIVDYLVRTSPCATMVVQVQQKFEQWYPKRILVPTNGTAAARQAAEFAFFLISNKDEEVTLLNVVAPPSRKEYPSVRTDVAIHQFGSAYQIVDELRQVGEMLDIATNAEVVQSHQPEKAIVSFAKKHKMDLIVLGTHLRSGSTRFFLGPKVETILNTAPCPVIVINSF